MYEGDARIFQDLVNSFGHLGAVDDQTRAVDEPFVLSVALHEVIVRGGKDLRQGVCGLRSVAGIGTQKDRADLRVGMQPDKGAVREDEHLLPGGYLLQTVPARIALPVGDGALGALSVSIRAPGLQVADGFSL